MGIATAALAVGLISVGQMGPLPHLASLTEELRGPARLAIAPDDSVLVTDPLERHIVRFDAAGSHINTWPVPEGPIGVAIHPDGRIFVSLLDTSKVAIFDGSFTFLEYLGEDEPLVSFATPTDIDIATDTGRIYVVDPEADRIYGFEGDGSLALILGMRGIWPGEFLYPGAITVDEPRNRIIVADHDKSRLQVFTTAGVFLQQFGNRLTSAGGGLEGWMPRPQGVAVDADGNTYLTDALMGTVRVFDPTGVELGKVVEYGHDAGALRVPCDLALSNNGSRLYVASTNGSSVEVYGTTSGGRDGGTPPTGLWHGLPDGSDDALSGRGGPRESSWNGPHMVVERPSICEACHGNTGQPGTHPGTVEGQGVLCMSCHSSGGRALNTPIHELDVADPFGTNPVAADGRGRSHAWGVSAVNPMADAVGPPPGSVMSRFLDGDGDIKCSTCHNQHNTDHGSLYLRVSNDGDAMCKECHAPRDTGPGEGGSHPVGFVYPEDEGEYPAASTLAPLFIKDRRVECMTCHAPHGADSGGAGGGEGDGMLLRHLNDETLCQRCHTQHAIHFVEGEWQPTCSDCHDIHDADNQNIALIAQQINGTAVAFVEGSAACNGQSDFIHSTCDPPTYDGVCEVCHADTTHHQNSPEADHTHHADMQCTQCHLHSDGFLSPACASCHGEPPDGTESPNRAGAHAVHFTAANGPHMDDCYACHASLDGASHDNGVVSFAAGVDDNGDGDFDLAETDVCSTCHSDGGPLDGVNDPVIGAKPNWLEGVYDGDVLKPEKKDWCLGCHDPEGAVIHDVVAPPLAGDNETWGYNVAGHGVCHVVCTDCHDPTLPHTDGVAKTFSERFPLCPGVYCPEFACKCPDERELDREAYNNGYRLRRVDGDRALEVPREANAYMADDVRLCLSCHDEIKLLGVPSNYKGFLLAPPHLQLPEGVAQTNYRNEYEWGQGWEGEPANVHWDHMSFGLSAWDIDHDGIALDSSPSCVTCHDSHGGRSKTGEPTAAMCLADLGIAFGVYDDGTTQREYGYIGSGAFLEPGGDLSCRPCHPWFGPGGDPPDTGYEHTRFYRERLDLRPEECLECHDDGRNK